MLGADLVRTRILKVFNTPDKSWGPRYPALTAWRRGFNDTVVVGVAVYPPKTPIPTKFTLPPQTATSSFLHQAEDTTTLSLFTHQIPALEYGTFSHLLVDSKTSDISFVVEDQEIPAHKNVLKSERAGPYFAGLLAHSFKENSDGRVTINDMAYKTFKAIFEYIYTGRTAVNAADDLFELYCLLAYIKGELILFLNNNLPKPNDLLSLIRRLQPYPDLSEAVRICVSGVLDKWDDVQASQQWGALVTGPGGKEFVETLLSEAARLHKQSKPAGNAKTGA
ncbi:hypothetical protein HK104_006159 [Borealophlyctis nickersoniae]|nr:hypothetical protein HK104_006159 [Borealophlyctis nickersoniae]